jgi:aryl-alcohol dehydrogenase-like predicted oxidoreductase
VQSEYSLLHREIEKDVLPYCCGHDIAVLAYSPLASGWLARQADGTASRGRLGKVWRDCLQPMAERYRTSTAALAIGWLLARPGVGAAISGVSSRVQLLEQVPAADLMLSDSDVQELSRAFSGLSRPDVQAASGGLIKRSLRFARRRGAGAVLRRAGIDPAALRRPSTRRHW